MCIPFGSPYIRQHATPPSPIGHEPLVIARGGREPLRCGIWVLVTLSDCAQGHSVGSISERVEHLFHKRVSAAMPL